MGVGPKAARSHGEEQLSPPPTPVFPAPFCTVDQRAVPVDSEHDRLSAWPHLTALPYPRPLSRHWICSGRRLRDESSWWTVRFAATHTTGAVPPPTPWSSTSSASGPSDPGDEMVVFGLLDPISGRRGVLASGFGPAADPDLLDHLTGLATRFTGAADPRSADLALDCYSPIRFHGAIDSSSKASCSRSGSWPCAALNIAPIGRPVSSS